MISVIDSGILMNTNYVPHIDGQIYVSSSAIDEVKSSIASHLFDLFSSKYDITVLDPQQKHRDLVIKISQNIGQNDLSQTDIDVLALARQLSEIDQVVILSDDYGLRNVAHELGIKSKGITTTGGENKRRYIFICRACNTQHELDFDECDVCGHKKFERKRIE